MFDGYKIVACIPSGRQRTMSLLMRHLRANADIIDGIQMWENVLPFDDHTKTAREDLDWIYSQADDLAVVIPLDPYEEIRVPKQLNTGRFYLNTTDEDTIYIRFDDDIVWLHPDAIRNLLRYRIDHPEPLAVFATIWNNAIVSALQQEAGHITKEHGIVRRYCMDDTGWKSEEFAVAIHEQLLDAIENGTTDQFYIDPFELVEESNRRRGQLRPVRFSVSCFAWFGESMNHHAEDLYSNEEEIHIAFVYPNLYDNFNHLAGDALVSHYSFFAQRDALNDRPEILAGYQDAADAAYHDAYYRLLATPKDPYLPKVWWQT